MFDDAGEYKGKVTAYDSPIYIADAALYLSKTKPELGIKDPYSLTTEQLDAATELLKKQRENISEYWSDYTKEVQAFESGTSVIGTTWQVIANTIGDREQGSGQHGAAEGRAPPGWSDTWMISSKAAHPNCMYKWMDWISSPEVNAQVAEHFGEAPAQHQGVRAHHRTGLLRHLPRHRRRSSPPRSTTGPPHRRSASTAAATTARPTPSGSTSGNRSRGDATRRLAAAARRRLRRRISLAFLLVPPMAWLVVAYLGSLAVLLVSAFWSTNAFTGAVVHTFTPDNIVRVLTDAGLPNGDRANRLGGADSHRDLRGAGGAAGVLHGQDRLAANATGARGGRDDPAVGQLSGQGVRVADAVSRRRARCPRRPATHPATG